jgi:hypothetical protein
VNMIMWVSQAYIVAENIKTAVVGIGTVPIKNYLVWRRNFSATTGLNSRCSYDDIPAMDEGCRVDVHTTRPPNMMPGANNHGPHLSEGNHHTDHSGHGHNRIEDVSNRLNQPKKIVADDSK